MRGLFLRLLLGALIAFVVLQVLAGIWAAVRVDRVMVRERVELVDEKVRWAATRLEATPVEERMRTLQALRNSLVLPLQLLPEDAPDPPDGPVLRLSDGTRLAAPAPGHPPPPPLGRIAGQVLLSVLALALVLVALGRPLLRDLEILERTARRIEGGDLSARTGLLRGPVAELGRQFDTMAGRVEGTVDGQKRLLEAVSHEIRTPLARARFRLEALRGQAADVDVDGVDLELDAVDDLLAELLDLARLDGAPRQPPIPDEAAAAVRAIVERMRGLSEVELEVRGDGRLPISARDLGRIVENLVSNAQRHACSRVVVVVGDGELIVEDDGEGVAPERADRIFEPFHTGDPSRSRSLGGIGLGLAITRRAALRWGATIQVDRGELGGARFVVRWT